MAKSTGNIARVAELLEGGISPRALRYALIAVQYRASLSFSDDTLPAAAAAVDRLDALFAALRAYREDGPDDPTLPAALDGIRTGFEAGLDDDLNVSAALGALFDGVRELNRRIDARSLSTADAARALQLLRSLDAVFAIGPTRTNPLSPNWLRWSTLGRPLAPRATGPSPTACATSSQRAASWWKTRGTASAGAA